MKTISLSLLMAILFTACHTGPDRSAEKVPDSPVNPLLAPPAKAIDSSNFTSITWVDKEINYGTLAEGKKLDVAFHFKNTGDKPLIIESVHPACGCTVAEPPKEPILPGNEGVIKGSFNSAGRMGINNKSIVVKANTLGSMSHDLRFKVEVIAP